MENQFPGYYRRSTEDLEKIWEDGLFVLDANVLLNPYRYSEGTRKELLRILHGVRDRLCIPHQAAEEFHRNRLDVIRAQKGAYKAVRTSLSEARKQIENQINAINRDSGIETRSLLEKVGESFDTLLAEAKKVEEGSRARSVPESYSPEGDDIWKEVNSIIEGRVGERLSPERMQEVRSEGPSRYASEVPPGYEDIDKPGDRKYGDLILWFEIIDMAGKTEKPILLVTDDRKEDWWQRSGGNAVEPHPDLANEMHHEVGVLFHMMLPLKFLKWASRKLDQEISQEAAEEIEELRSLEEPEDTLYEDLTVGTSSGGGYADPATADDVLRRVKSWERLSNFDPERVSRQVQRAEEISRLGAEEYLKRHDPQEQLRRIDRMNDLIRRLNRGDYW